MQRTVVFQSAWEPTSKGRALPPRPTLLVGEAGDVDACRHSWRQLQPRAQELLARLRAGSATPDEVDSCVRRFRSLRESLVAAYVRDSLAVQVYEASADVCCAAGVWAEALKCLNALTSELYPATCQQQQQQLPPPQQQHASEGEAAVAGARDATAGATAATAAVAIAAAADGAGCSTSSSTCSSSTGCSTSGREGEFYAAHVLFFACVPAAGAAAAGASGGGRRGAAGGGDTLSLLRSRQLAPYLGSGHVGFAVQVLAALSRGDWFAFLSLRQDLAAATAAAAAATATGASAAIATTATATTTEAASTATANASAAAGGPHAARPPNGQPPPPPPSALLLSILDAKAPQARTAALRAVSAAFRSLPAAALASALRLPDSSTSRCSGSSSSSFSSSSSTSSGGPGDRSSGTGNGSSSSSGSDGGAAAAAAAELRAALVAAEAAGVRGAGVALEGLSAWAEPAAAAAAAAAASAGAPGYAGPLSMDLAFKAAAA